jgi:uroporphyrinogen-III synthase
MDTPLDGRCVLVTRPRAQATELIGLLESAGARVVVAPTVRIVPPTDPVPLQRVAADLAQFDWIVFSSANGVDALFDAIPAHDADPTAPVARTLSAPRNAVRTDTLPKIAAVGTRTAERIRARGLEVTLVPDEFTAEGLVRGLTSRTNLAGARVLLPRSEIGREVIAEGLRAAGAVVTDVIAYRTVAEQEGDEAAVVRRLLTERGLDAVTFTSGSAVQNFIQMYGPDIVELLRHTVVAVIGPVTAGVARELGLAVQVQPTTYTAAGMVETLSRHFMRRA